jgi:hypothetical protein
MNPDNKVKLAALSMSASSPDGDDGPYLEWHQLDHMPEQYQIPGLMHAQRWASTPECRAARAVQSERLAPMNHLVQYLMGEPLLECVDEWFTLGAELYQVGRFPYRLPAVMMGAFDVVACHAAASASVTAEVLPYRPNRGIYYVVELPDEAGAPAPWDTAQLERLLAVDGVAGLWALASNPAIRPDRFEPIQHHAHVVYLDRDPLEVAPAVAAVFADRWNDAPVTPQLAAPFLAVPPFGWNRFRHPGA